MGNDFVRLSLANLKNSWDFVCYNFKILLKTRAYIRFTLSKDRKVYHFFNLETINVKCACKRCKCTFAFLNSAIGYASRGLLDWGEGRGGWEIRPTIFISNKRKILGMKIYLFLEPISVVRLVVPSSNIVISMHKK